MYSIVWPQRVIVDTNVLLNAALNRGGVAELCVRVLRQRQVPMYTSPRVDSEVSRVTRPRSGRAADAWPAVQAFSRANEIISAQTASGIPIPGLNNADQPVGRSAVAIGAALITDDLEFLAAMRRAGYTAFQPWLIARAHQGAVPDMLKIIRFSDWNAAGGFVFARATPGAWAGIHTDQRFTVYDAEQQASLSYDARTERWVFDINDGLSIETPHRISTQAEQCVMGWVKCGRGRATAVLCAWSGATEPSIVRREMT